MIACLDESGFYLSIGLVFIFSLSNAFISLLLLFLQHEHQHALAFIFFVTRSFRLPEFSFFSFLGTCRRVQHGQYSAVVLRRSA